MAWASMRSIMIALKAAFYMLLFSAMVVYLFVVFKVASWYIERPPVDVLGTRVIDSNAHPGGTVELEYTVFRHKLCQTNIQRFLYAGEERQRIILEQVSLVGGGVLNRPDTYRKTITIPSNAPLGPATLVTLVSHACNPIQFFWPTVSLVQDVPITITPASHPPFDRDKDFQ